MRGLRPISPRTTICTLFGSVEPVELGPFDFGALRRQSYCEGRESKAIVNMVETKAVIVKIACSILSVQSQDLQGPQIGWTICTMEDGENRVF